jgi:hypothetical protein
MTDEKKPEALSWVDVDALEKRAVRGEELTFDEMLTGVDQGKSCPTSLT